MKIKLKNKSNKIEGMLCFFNKGYCSTTIDKLNSGEEVTVDRIPTPAVDLVSEIKKPKKKGSK